MQYLEHVTQKNKINNASKSVSIIHVVGMLCLNVPGTIRGALTLTLLTWTIWRAPTNASKWRIGFNSAFKGLTGRSLIDNFSLT